MLNKLNSLFRKQKKGISTPLNLLPDMEETADGIFVNSNHCFTEVQKKSDTIFTIGDIEGTKNEILEVADFINNAKFIITSGLFSDSDSYVDGVYFMYNESNPEIAPAISFGIMTTDTEESEGYGKPVSIGKTARNRLDKTSFLRQNIVKIAEYMNKYIKEKKLDDIEEGRFALSEE